MYKITIILILISLAFANQPSSFFSKPLDPILWNSQQIWSGTGTLRLLAIGNKIKGPTDDTFRILSVQSSGQKYVILSTDTSHSLPMKWRTEIVDTGACWGCGICDVDRDGKNDLVYDRLTGPYYVARCYWDPSTSTWITERITTMPGGSWGMTVGDANNDGYTDDIVYAASTMANSKLHWAFWDGHTWQDSIIWNGDGRTIYGIAIGKFDAAHPDSNEIVAVTGGTSGGPGGRVMRIRRAGGVWDTLTLWMQATTVGSISLQKVAIGDFDSHNLGNEIAAVNGTIANGSINGSVFEIYGSGTTWSKRTLFSAERSYWGVAVGDVMNTNPGDEIVFSDNGSPFNVRVIWGAGDEWNNDSIFSYGSGSSFGVAIGDVNRHRTLNQEIAVTAGPISTAGGAVWEAEQRDIDVGCTKILAPVGTIDSGTVVVPACSVYNYGTTIETYLVRMKIAGFYNDTARVTNHNPGTYQYVTLPITWTAMPRGTFAITCSTELATDVVPANDKATGQVVVRVRDVGAMRIVVPKDTIPFGTPVTPQAWVRNFGTHPESFTVRFKIGGIYTRDTTVTNLGSHDSILVQFTAWTPVDSTYATSCSTQLATDQDNSNDKATGMVTVRKHDVGAMRIAAPKDTIPFGTPVTPQAWVRNFGYHTTETFDVVFKIGGLYTDTKTVTSLVPRDSALVQFISWTPVESTYATSCSTQLATDQDNSNDKATGTATVRRHDVGVTRIVFPIDTVFGGNLIIPKARIKNFSYHTTETFNVTFEIGTIYTSTKTVTNLGPRDSTIVNFDVWTATLGSYNTAAYSALAGDQNLSNDSAYGQFVVQAPQTNVGTIAILAPKDTIPANVPIAPSATVQNFGSNPATFTVRFKIIGTSYNQVVTVAGLAPNASQEVVFPSWSPIPCDYVTSCSTELATDQTPENDKMTGSVTVQLRDVGIASILAPRDTLLSGNDYQPMVVVGNYGMHAYPEICTVSVRIIRYPIRMESSYCNVAPDTIHSIVVYDTSMITTVPLGLDTIYFPIWHPYWWDLYWTSPAAHHIVTAQVSMSADMNSGNNMVANRLVVKGRSNDLEVNWAGLLNGYNPIHAETIGITTYNVASVVSNSPFGPAARIRVRAKIVRESRNLIVYSRYLDPTLQPRSYTCVAFQGGWAPSDTGWYRVESRLETKPGVDVVTQNNSTQKRYYVNNSTPIAKTNRELNPAVQGNSINIPNSFGLMPNNPNPFQTHTTIQWQIPIESKVTITIYDAAGRNIKTLVKQQFTPGYYSTTWNCTNDNNQKVAAGVYFYEMRADKYISRHKLVIAH